MAIRYGMSTNQGYTGGQSYQTKPKGSVLGVSTTANMSGSNYTPQRMSTQTPSASKTQSTPNQITTSTTQPVLSTMPMPSAPSAPSMEELDSIYNPAMSYLGQAEANLRADLPNVISAADADYAASTALLAQQRSQGLTDVEMAQSAAQRRNEDAVAAQRRLYQELRQANQQRFGAASSAGVAASELQSRELASNRAALSRDFDQTMKQIESERTKINQGYEVSLQQLNADKQNRINQIQSDFNNKLLQINQNRSMLEQEKAAARLDALQNARQQAFQIEMQNYQFQQQLEQARASQTQYLDQYSSQLSSALTGANTAQNQFALAATVNPQSDFTVGQGSQYGMSTPTGAVYFDEFGRPIVGQMTPQREEPPSLFRR